jgi:hypothetical protein
VRLLALRHSIDRRAADRSGGRRFAGEREVNKDISGLQQ